ncbi:MAG TPA: hypothetical protein VFU69_18540, partial [Ktedonobacterales bacterium]|nr:hypothetical protein [Ktedonobacterales bacterium]
GETLTLDRRRTLGHILAFGGLILFCVVVIAFCGEAMVFTLLPTFGHSTLNPFYFLLFDVAPAPAPSLLDWLTAAYPLAVSLLLLAIIPYLLADQRYTVLADEEGLTIRQSFRQRRFMPWNDIALFIQTGQDRNANVSAAYLLWGREHKVTFVIVRLPQASNASRKGASRIDRLDSYRFTGGFDHYAADAQRLLATIAARGPAPLQTLLGTPPGVTSLQRRFPSTFRADDLAAAPLASQELRPHVQDAAPADAAISEITLKARDALSSFLLEMLLWFIPLGAICFVVMKLTYPEYVSDPSSLSFIAVAALIFVLGCLLAASLASSRRRQRAPIVIADARGLTQKTDQKSTTITIPWDEVRSWAIMPSPNQPQTRRRYLVSSERATITWTERADAELAGRGVQGDRRLAYQEHAEQLHRLIAARTGLPLRNMTSQQP